MLKYFGVQYPGYSEYSKYFRCLYCGYCLYSRICTARAPSTRSIQAFSAAHTLSTPTICTRCTQAVNTARTPTSLFLSKNEIKSGRDPEFGKQFNINIQYTYLDLLSFLLCSEDFVFSNATFQCSLDFKKGVRGTIFYVGDISHGVVVDRTLNPIHTVIRYYFLV